jgi:hypothetical protein
MVTMILWELLKKPTVGVIIKINRERLQKMIDSEIYWALEIEIKILAPQER